MVLIREELKQIKRQFQRQLKAGKNLDEVKVFINGNRLFHIGDNCFSLGNQQLFFDGRLTSKEKKGKKYSHVDNELFIRVFDVDDIQFSITGREDYHENEIVYLNI